MFAPLVHGQNRNSGLPIVDDDFMWIDTQNENISLDGNGDIFRYFDVRSDSDYGATSLYGKSGGITIKHYYSDPITLISNDPDFSYLNSSLLSPSESELDSGLYKIETISSALPPPPQIYSDATFFIVLEYYPFVGMESEVIWSWQSANDNNFDMFEYVSFYEGMALKKMRKNLTGWSTEYTLGTFAHNKDPDLYTNKVVLCFTTRAAWVNGIKVMDSYPTSALRASEQMKVDQYTTLFNSIYVYDINAGTDTPLNKRFNNGKFAEALLYPRQLFDSEIIENSKWLMNKYNIS